MLFNSIVIRFYKKSTGDVWSGVNDRATDGTFVCSTSTQVPSTFFHPGEPNGGSYENCAKFGADFDFFLVDVPCGMNYIALCEKDAHWVWFSKPVRLPCMGNEWKWLNFFLWELFKTKITQLNIRWPMFQTTLVHRCCIISFLYQSWESRPHRSALPQLLQPVYSRSY